MTATYVAPDDGLTHRMIDGDHIAKAAVTATEPGFELFLVRAAATPPAPQHMSPWTGVLYVLRGTVSVQADGFTGDVGPGGVVVAPAGTPVTFFVPEGTAEFLAVTSGTSAGRFFAEMSSSVSADHLDAEAFGTMASVAAKHGVALAGV